MANVSVIKLKIRRGTDAQRQQVTLDQGEPGWVQDSTGGANYNRLFVGDGSTPGGISVGVKYYATSTGITAATTSSADHLYTVQTGDLVYDQTSNHVYVLTGSNTFFNVLTAYKQLV